MKKSMLVLFVLVSIASTLGATQPMQKKNQKQTVWKEVPAQQTGIGFSSQFSRVGLNSLAIRHWLSDGKAIDAAFGFSMGDAIKIFGIGAKYIAAIKEEPNLKFYGFGGLGIENIDINGTSDTGLMIVGGLGWEFFLPGLNNLGFNIECGLGHASTKDIKVFGTEGFWLNHVGIRYYL